MSSFTFTTVPTPEYFDEEISFPVYQRDEATLSNALALITQLDPIYIEVYDLPEDFDLDPELLEGLE
jgi:hypothetical protein